MRHWLAHHYFDTSRTIVEATITEDHPPLEEAVLQLEARLEFSWHRNRNPENREKGNGGGLGRQLTETNENLDPGSSVARSRDLSVDLESQNENEAT
jgi:hypothetical protein